MPNIKKIINALFCALLCLMLTSCSSLTPEQMVDKIANSTKNIKSANFISTTVIENITKDNSQKIEMTMESSIIKNPEMQKTTVITKQQNSDDGLYTAIYIKDNNVYLTSDNNNWIKYSGDLITSQFKSLNKLESLEKNLELYKKIAKDFKGKKDNNRYILTYSGSGDEFKTLLIDILNSNATGQKVNEDSFNDINIKNVNIEYIVSDNFTPSFSTISMELESKNDSNQIMKISQNASYDNINSVSTIDIPEDAFNKAREIKTE